MILRVISGGRLRIECMHNCTALNVARLGYGVGRADIVKFLVTYEASVNLPNCYGTTPLMGAAYAGKVDVVKYVMEQGAKINAANLAGNIPLCFAAMNGHC